MHVAPHLTKDEFKQIHNALCSLRHIRDDPEGVLPWRIEDRLSDCITEFEAALAGAYKSDSEKFAALSDLFDTIRDENGFISIWSLYDIEDLSQPHPFGEVATVRYEADNGTAVCTVSGKTWLDLWRTADMCIRASCDRHHIFVERFSPSPKDPTSLLLHTGS